MENLMTITSYIEFKRAFDGEIHRQSEGFVRMGYLLRRAADTDLLLGSGYKTISEFAMAEYGLTEDTVSRLISINKRYSQDGYADQLQEKYSNYGYTLLAEMLNISDEVIEAIPENITREGIREIKKEIKEEAKTTDLEVLMEGEDKRHQGMKSSLEKVLHQYYRENMREYPEMYKDVHSSTDLEDTALRLLAPSGVGVKMIRIQGIGKMMMSIKGRDQNLELVNLRTNEKEIFGWKECANILVSMCNGGGYKAAFEVLYGEPYPEAEKEKGILGQSGERKSNVEIQKQTRGVLIEEDTSTGDTNIRESEQEGQDAEKEQMDADTRVGNETNHGVEAEKVEAEQQEENSINTLESGGEKEEIALAQVEAVLEVIENPYKEYLNEVEISIAQIRELLQEENFELAYKAGKDLVSALLSIHVIHKEKNEQLEGQMEIEDY